MRNFVALFAMLFTILLSAQENYYTIYNFTVAPEDNARVYQLVNDYYSKNKPAGITVALWENHFNDSGNNFSHSIVFLGPLDNLGTMYNSDGGDSWSLFLTRLNQHIKEGFSSSTGHPIAIHGDTNEDYPVQRYFILDVEDEDKFTAAYNKFQTGHLAPGTYTAMGVISVGRSPEGESHWAIMGFKDFKAGIGGATSLMSAAAVTARDKAWSEFMANHGGVRLVRSGLRVRLGQW